MIRKTILYFMAATAFAFAQGRQTDLADLIQKIDERTKTYKEYHDFSASAVNVSREMDDHWKPEKTTTIYKQIIQSDSNRTETIIKAIEARDGKETDVTEKIRMQAEKQKERAKRPPRVKVKPKEEGQPRSYSVGFKELYPFSPEARGQFLFTQKKDTVISGTNFMRIQTRAKDRKSRQYEGDYMIDPKTYDLLFLDTAPAKNPKFVKDMRLSMAFAVLPGNIRMFKSFRMKVYASIVIKKIRLEIDETYSDLQITN